MFGIGLPELFIILVIALVVLGPERLPDLARAIGRGIGEFRKATDEIKQSFDADDDLRELKNQLTQAKKDVTDTVRNQTKGMKVEELADSLADGTFFSDAKSAKTGEPGITADTTAERAAEATAETMAVMEQLERTEEETAESGSDERKAPESVESTDKTVE